MCKEIPCSLSSKSKENSSSNKLLLSLYQTIVQMLIKSFEYSVWAWDTSTQQTCWCISYFVFKIDVPDETVDMKVMKRALRTTVVDLNHLDSFSEQDWRSSVVQSLDLQSSTMLANWKILLLLRRSLSSGSIGMLARVLSLTEPKEELCRIHDFLVERMILACALAGARNLLSWMARDAVEMQLACTKCQDLST